MLIQLKTGLLAKPCNKYAQNPWQGHHEHASAALKILKAFPP